MTNEQLFETIFRRKSIRKYHMNPLPREVMAKLEQYTQQIRPLDSSIAYAFHYLHETEVKNLLPIKAPHYICIYSENKENYLINAGYLLQQIDLYLSVNNLGSCWLGMAKPSKNVPDLKNGMEFVIMLAFGSADETLHRKEMTEFKRKTLKDISSISDAEELLTPVRLAPSATNSQPWFFSGSREEMLVSRKKLNIIKAPIYDKMNQIDMGIALSHLVLSLEHQGKEVHISFKKDEAPKGYVFMAKIKGIPKA